jgi:hypothetical protein
MAMTPPGPGGAAGGAAAPPLSPTSPETLAAAMHAGAPAPAPPAPAPAVAAPPGASGAAPPTTSPASPYSDLPADLPHHYQLLDVADRQLKQAIATGGFYKEPEVLAGLRHIEGQLSKIIATYARGGDKGPLEAPAIQVGTQDDQEGEAGPAVPIGDEETSEDVEA